MSVSFNTNANIVEIPRWCDEDNDIIKKGPFYEKLLNQKLKGTHFVVTAKWAISTTVFFGLFFIGISFIIRSANEQVILEKIRYDNLPGPYFEFQLPRMEGPIFFYYELRNTKRIHRLYNKAFCNAQLLSSVPDDMKECDKPQFSWHLKYYLCENEYHNITSVVDIFAPKFCSKDARFYAPMGAVASTMFNDTFLLKRGDQTIRWTEEGISNQKIRNVYAEPEDVNNLCTSPMFNNTLKPIGWKNHICEMGGYRNESFVNWMGMVAYKNFKKLYRKLDDKYHANGLSSGVYRLYFENNYWYHNMEKYFWILRPSWIGTKQEFLERAYLIVGIGFICLSIGLVALQICLLNRRIVIHDHDE